ncbi:MAG TPA: DoxX family protein [Verrucomicrobiae bacterium]|nr:DoxX family protein [Verrucomicrobiae bacterium]
MNVSEINKTSKPMLWTGRVLSGLSALFLLMDGVMKLVKPAPVLEATTRLGFPEHALTAIGVVLIVSTILYLIPRTAVLGAILLTGFLGGAVATHVRAGSPAFETLFPVIFGVLIWGGLFLKDASLRALFTSMPNR